MKISKETFAQLTDAIQPIDTEVCRARYRAGEFPRASETKDINKRYRWDLFYFIRGFEILDGQSDITTEHIDTALRRIVPSL